MAIKVYMWEQEYPGLFTTWQCVCPDTPQVNATSAQGGAGPIDLDGTQCREYIVEAYNREISPTPAVTLDDFEFTAPPEGWENPNA